MEKIIEQLKDDKNYYGELGKKYLSNSDIYDLINNPNDFQKPKEQSVAFEYGQAFHEMLLSVSTATLGTSNCTSGLFNTSATNSLSLALLTSFISCSASLSRSIISRFFSAKASLYMFVLLELHEINCGFVPNINIS